VVALQRCDDFVGRTTNWLYDHLRFVPRYVPIALSDRLLNREEFPAIEARALRPPTVSRRLWHRMAGHAWYPTDRLWLRRRRPAVLHSHFGWVAAHDGDLQRMLDVPWLVSFYGADVYALGRLAEWQDRYARVFERASRVLALGPVMAAHLKELGCPEEKLAIHPLGVAIDALPAKPRRLQPEEPLRLLFAGTFREKKGLEYVIAAAALARRAGVRLELHLVGDIQAKPGDRETRDRVVRQIGELGLASAVTRHSFLEFCQLIDLALRCHVFVAPSVTAADGDAEGTPFVLQQMMATGMPVIATVHSDIPYLFGEHAHMLVPERDAAAIAQRLERYAERPGALVADGAALSDRIRHAFDVRECAGRLANEYDTIRRAHRGFPSGRPVESDPRPLSGAVAS
jgi:colanic acid/amylovoran biosynthesis glycosyltransferase